MDVNQFTVAMRKEFVQGLQDTFPEQSNWKDFTTVIPSTARIESYGYMTPSAGIARYTGYRRYSQADFTKYPIPNLEFDDAFSVSLIDVDDDKIGGYPMRFRELGQNANQFPEVFSLQTLQQGATTVCFDGSNFFQATAHNQGDSTIGTSLPSPFTGGYNNLTYTSANSADGLLYDCVFLLHYHMIKPLAWQTRQSPKLGTNSGTPASEEAKQLNYWIDMRGNSLYGWWWDAVRVHVINTPNLQDIFIIIDQVQKMFRSFIRPQGLPTDPKLFIHQNVQFSPKVGTVVSGIGLGSLFEHALNEERIGVSVAGATAGFTNNIFRGKWGLVITGYMNTSSGL